VAGQTKALLGTRTVAGSNLGHHLSGRGEGPLSPAGHGNNLKMHNRNSAKIKTRVKKPIFPTSNMYYHTNNPTNKLIGLVSEFKRSIYKKKILNH